MLCSCCLVFEEKQKKFSTSRAIRWEELGGLYEKDKPFYYSISKNKNYYALRNDGGPGFDAYNMNDGQNNNLTTWHSNRLYDGYIKVPSGWSESYTDEDTIKSQTRVCN